LAWRSASLFFDLIEFLGQRHLESKHLDPDSASPRMPCTPTLSKHQDLRPVRLVDLKDGDLLSLCNQGETEDARVTFNRAL
jgi:hypothetical protein